MEHCVPGRTSAVISRLSLAWLQRAVKGWEELQDSRGILQRVSVWAKWKFIGALQREIHILEEICLLSIYNEAHAYLRWIGLMLFSFITVTITTWQPDRLHSPNHKHAVESRQNVSFWGRTWCHFVSLSSLVPLKWFIMLICCPVVISAPFPYLFPSITMYRLSGTLWWLTWQYFIGDFTFISRVVTHAIALFPSDGLLLFRFLATGLV